MQFPRAAACSLHPADNNMEKGRKVCGNQVQGYNSLGALYVSLQCVSHHAACSSGLSTKSGMRDCFTKATRLTWMVDLNQILPRDGLKEKWDSLITTSFDELKSWRPVVCGVWGI